MSGCCVSPGLVGQSLELKPAMIGCKLADLVIDLETQVWRAVTQRDGAALGKLFADDYLEITLDGMRIEKAAIVKQSPQVDEIDGYAMDSQRVMALGNGCALLSYHLQLDGRTGGVTIAPRDRWVTSIWVYRDGTWQCSFFQQSPYADQGREGT